MDKKEFIHGLNFNLSKSSMDGKISSVDKIVLSVDKSDISGKMMDDLLSLDFIHG